MFTLFRYGLTPVVLYCFVLITAGIDAFLTNTVRKATWPQTVVTVVQSQDFGDVAAAFRGTPNTFPDPRGTLWIRPITESSFACTSVELSRLLRLRNATMICRLFLIRC